MVTNVIELRSKAKICAEFSKEFAVKDCPGLASDFLERAREYALEAIYNTENK